MIFLIHFLYALAVKLSRARWSKIMGLGKPGVHVSELLYYMY